MAKRYYLTVAQLQKAGACPGGLLRFRKLLDGKDRISVTPANAIRLARIGVRTGDIYFLAHNFLSAPRFRAFERSLDAADDAYLLKIRHWRDAHGGEYPFLSPEGCARRARQEALALAFAWQYRAQRQKDDRLG